MSEKEETIPVQNEVEEEKEQDRDAVVEGNKQDVQERSLARRMQRHEEASIAIPSHVMLLSGCTDKQTSAGVPNVGIIRSQGEGESGGVCTAAFLDTLENGGVEESWKAIIDTMRKKLRNNAFVQIPQLSTSRSIDLSEEKFSVINANDEENSTKRALLIGINYFGEGEGRELYGCVTDAMEVKEFLLKQGFTEFFELYEREGDAVPTRENILEGFRWLRSGLGPNSSCFVHYSGHGSQNLDKDGDEVDGKDECLIPVDFFSAGSIVSDDEIMRELVLPLPDDTKLTCLFDCCHSGTLLDLPFVAQEFDGVTKREVVSNDSFNFSWFVKLGKELADDAAETLTGGLKRLAEFAKSFGNVIPI